MDLPKTRKSDGEDISAVIIDKMVSSSYDFQTEGKSAARRSVNRRSISGRSSTSAASLSSAIETVSSDVSVRQVKLSPEDKSKTNKMYADLDKTKMWKLSTGTLVEEQMMKHVIIQDYEHLSHSFILNVQDTCWSAYFSPEEIEEIKRFDAVELPLLPFDTSAYVDELKATPKSILYDKVNEGTYASNSGRKWIQVCYNACFRLVQSGFFPLRDVTEQGIGKRM